MNFDTKEAKYNLADFGFTLTHLRQTYKSSYHLVLYQVSPQMSQT